MTAHTQLLLDFLPALGFRLSEPTEVNGSQVAEDSYVVEAETARANDTDARSFRQITTPRSLASTKRISSLTSGSASTSF